MSVLSVEKQLNTCHDDVAILIVSCDAYQVAWKPFFQCFFKYWADCPYPVFLGSNYLTFSDSRVSSILVGPDVDYSSNLQIMLDQIEQNWVIFSNEDQFLAAPVKTSSIKGFVELCEHEQIGSLRLWTGPNLATQVEDDMQGIGEIAKGTPYRVSMALGLWQKSVLSQLLHPGETAWDLERKGTIRSNDLESRFFAVSKDRILDPPITTVHGIRKRKWTADAVPFLKREGLSDALEMLPQPSLWTKIYERIYSKIRALTFGLFFRLGLIWRGTNGSGQ